MSGAVDLEECPQVGQRTFMLRIRRCRCGICSICGYPKHSAVHGPVNDGAPGSRPFDHEFLPRGVPAPEKETER